MLSDEGRHAVDRSEMMCCASCFLDAHFPMMESTWIIGIEGWQTGEQEARDEETR